MKPDASKHDPNPEYLRALIVKAGLSQRAAARAIGIHERQLRFALYPEDHPNRRAADYRTQYALEGLAGET